MAVHYKWSVALRWPVLVCVCKHDDVYTSLHNVKLPQFWLLWFGKQNEHAHFAHTGDYPTIFLSSAFDSLPLIQKFVAMLPVIQGLYPAANPKLSSLIVSLIESLSIFRRLPPKKTIPRFTAVLTRSWIKTGDCNALVLNVFIISPSEEVRKSITSIDCRVFLKNAKAVEDRWRKKGWKSFFNFKKIINLKSISRLG